MRFSSCHHLRNWCGTDLSRLDPGNQGSKRKDELLPDRQSLAFVLADDLRFALVKGAEHAIDQDHCIGIVAASFFVAGRMVLAMSLDGRPDESVPAGRSEAYIGVIAGGHQSAHVQRAEDRVFRHIEQRYDAECYQKQLYRIAYCALGRVQLSDVMMRR